jgi:hypothetical protein
MNESFELTDDQGKQARRLLDLASAIPSRSAAVVLGQIHRREGNKIVLTMKVVPPDQAMRIAKILIKT